MKKGTSRMFFSLTLEWLCSYVPIKSFRLMVLLNRVQCQCYNETNIPPSYFKNATKNNIFQGPTYLLEEPS